MPINTPDISTYIEAGARAAALRQAAIANNIANLNTPGYRRRVVEFEELLTAIREGREVSMDQIQGRLRCPMNTVVDEKGNDVSLDQEIGDLIRNTGSYKTYVRLLAKVHRQIEMAINL